MNPYSFYQQGFFPQHQNIQKIYNLHLPSSSSNATSNTSNKLDSAGGGGVGFIKSNTNSNNNNNSVLIKSSKTGKQLTSSNNSTQKHLPQNLHKIYNLHLPSDKKTNPTSTQIKSSKSSKAVFNILNNTNSSTNGNSSYRYQNGQPPVKSSTLNRHQSQPSNTHILNSSKQSTNSSYITKYTVPKLPQTKYFPSTNSIPSNTTTTNNDNDYHKRYSNVHEFNSKLIQSKSAIDLSAPFYSVTMPKKGK